MKKTNPKKKLDYIEELELIESKEKKQKNILIFSVFIFVIVVSIIGAFKYLSSKNEPTAPIYKSNLNQSPKPSNVNDLGVLPINTKKDSFVKSAENDLNPHPEENRIMTNENEKNIKKQKGVTFETTPK